MDEQTVKKALSKKPRSRKPQINGEIRKRIFNYLSDGDSIKKIAEKMAMSRTTIYRWMKRDAKLAEMIELGREIQAEKFAGELVKIADDDSKDVLLDKVTGRTYPNAAAVARDKLRIATRKSMMSYYNARKYSQKTNIHLSADESFKGLIITPPEKEEKIEKETTE